ncbi:MAG: hypothetical protein R2705_23130 [Ilumatobacteraceae bacterium]
MVSIADEIETMIIELGVDARLLRLQFEELYGDTDTNLLLILRDYLAVDSEAAALRTEARLEDLSDEELLDLRAVARCLGLRRPRISISP